MARGNQDGEGYTRVSAYVGASLTGAISTLVRVLQLLSVILSTVHLCSSGLMVGDLVGQGQGSNLGRGLGK